MISVDSLPGIPVDLTILSGQRSKDLDASILLCYSVLFGGFFVLILMSKMSSLSFMSRSMQFFVSFTVFYD